MTVAELIARYNEERPNEVPDEKKLDLIKRCEKMILNDIVLMYDDADEMLSEFDMNYRLVVPLPYDDIYIYYMDMRIALNNNDAQHYNRAKGEYNDMLVSFQQYFNRTTRPKRVNKHMIDHTRL